MSRLLEAQAYVGTDPVCGSAQLNLAQREGLKPSDNVLEIGCGCLSAGAHLLRYLTTGRYVGIEPNRWLVDAALENQALSSLAKEKGALFLDVENFDAGMLDTKFDFVLSHSVLSHCARWQVRLFIQNAIKVLSSKGTILASFRMAEGNAYGSPGSTDLKDSTVSVWQYPGIAWYTQQTICSIAHYHGMIALLRPDYTRYFVSVIPKDIHDWVVIRRPSPL